MHSSTQTVDLLISHSQIQVRSRPYDEASSQWGNFNVNQGVVIHKDYVVFDPLPQDTFGANVHLISATEFSADLRAQRRIVVPFFVSEMDSLELASATEKVKITLDLDQRHYALHYEICEGAEIFYKITFVPSITEPDAKFLMDDPWGGAAGQLLVRGTA